MARSRWEEERGVQTRRRGKRRRAPHVSSSARGVSSNTLSCVSRFPLISDTLSLSLSRSSRKKRHLVQTITPVPGAIGHQQRVKAAAITNSDSLIPFIPPRVPSSSLSLLVATSPLRSFHSFSHFPFLVSPSLARSLARPPARALRRRSPAPFTFAHYSRKSNFVTRAGSSTRARIPSSIPEEITCRSAPQARKKISLIKRRFLLPSTAYCMSTYTQQSTPTMTRARGKRETLDPVLGMDC